MSAIPIICALCCLLCLLVCAWILLEAISMARRVKAALDEMSERQDLFFQIQKVEKQFKEVSMN